MVQRETIEKEKISRALEIQKERMLEETVFNDEKIKALEIKLRETSESNDLVKGELAEKMAQLERAKNKIESLNSVTSKENITQNKDLMLEHKVSSEERSEFIAKIKFLEDQLAVTSKNAEVPKGYSRTRDADPRLAQRKIEALSEELSNHDNMIENARQIKEENEVSTNLTVSEKKRGVTLKNEETKIDFFDEQGQRKGHPEVQNETLGVNDSKGEKCDMIIRHDVIFNTEHDEEEKIKVSNKFPATEYAYQQVENTTDSNTLEKSGIEQKENLVSHGEKFDCLSGNADKQEKITGASGETLGVILKTQLQLAFKIEALTNELSKRDMTESETLKMELQLQKQKSIEERSDGVFKVRALENQLTAMNEDASRVICDLEVKGSELLVAQSKIEALNHELARREKAMENLLASSECERVKFDLPSESETETKMGSDNTLGDCDEISSSSFETSNQNEHDEQLDGNDSERPSEGENGKKSEKRTKATNDHHEQQQHESLAAIIEDEEENDLETPHERLYSTLEVGNLQDDDLTSTKELETNLAASKPKKKSTKHSHKSSRSVASRTLSKKVKRLPVATCNFGGLMGSFLGKSMTESSSSQL